jgi:hypothetical protein
MTTSRRFLDVGQRAGPAERVHRPADLLAPGDEMKVDVGPPPPGGGRVERPLRLLGRLRLHPAEAVRNAVHVCVDADVVWTLVRDDQDQGRGLSPDARQRQQAVHGRRHVTAEPLDNLPAALAHVPGLRAVEAHGIDQALDARCRELRERGGRVRHREEAERGRVGHRVLGLGREHGRDERLEGGAGVLLRELLDGRQLHALDLAAQPSHHDIDWGGLGMGEQRRPGGGRSPGHERSHDPTPSACTRVTGVSP